MDSNTVVELYSKLTRLKELTQEKDEIINELFRYVKDLETENALLRDELNRRDY